MIRYATEADLVSLQALWEACFPQDADYAATFFTHLYKPEQALLYEEENGVVSGMMHLMPHELAMLNRHVKATYFYAVGTLPDYRRQGRIRMLMSRALSDARERGSALAMLVPQERWLFDFYRKFQFDTTFQLRYPLVEPTVMERARRASPEDIPELNRRYRRQFENRWYVLRDTAHWEQVLREYEIWMWDSGGYAVKWGDKVLEAGGEGVTIDPPVRPFGMVRIVEAAEFADVLPLEDWQITDEECPWNNSTGQRDITPAQMAARLFGNGLAYMNLMHN